MIQVKLRAVSAAIFNLVLVVGCFWQLLSVCQMYFKYPTNISIETKYGSLSTTLPAITFCTDIDSQWGRNSSAVLQFHSNKFGNQTLSDVSIVIESTDKNVSIKDIFVKNAIERISLCYYCITFNSLISGSKLFKMIEIYLT